MPDSSKHSIQQLLYITQWFAPEPVQVPVWIADALRDRGWHVEVLTAHPNYPTGRVHVGHDSRRFTRALESGHRVQRAPVYASHDLSALRRMASYLSWALSSSLVAPMLARRADVCLVYSSPATAALPAMVARALTRRPYVLLVQDVWPDSVTATGLLRHGRVLNFIEKLLGAFVRATYRMADTVLVISPGARDLLVSRGTPAGKVHLVYNWADESVLRPLPRHGRLREKLGLDDEEFLLMYAGTTGPAQGLDNAIEAIARTKCRAHLVILGDGIARPDLERQALASTAAERVHFLEPVPVSEVAEQMAGADAQLVSLRDHPLFEITLPSKVQGVLATGSICVASAPGDAARIVQDAGGWGVRPSDPDALAQAIDEVADLNADSRAHLRESAYSYYQNHLSAAVGAGALSDALRSAADNRKAKRQ